MSRRRRRFLLVLLALVLVLGASYGGLLFMTDVPGKSFRGPLAALTPAESELAGELRRHVTMLASKIGERNARRLERLEAAVRRIEAELARVGSVRRHEFRAGERTFTNLDLEVPGTVDPERILVVGAHYDTAIGTPGANDNASGVASVLALARRFARRPAERTIRFVAFANEEPPWFKTSGMGSLV